MRFSLSTNWNSREREDGDAMLDEIAALGFDRIELGYALTHVQSDAVRRRVRAGEFRVSSVHAFSPFPLPGVRPDPEPYSICDRKDFRGRRRAIGAVLECARFASEMQAPAMVLHAGRAPVFHAARRLQHLVEDGLRRTPKYEKALFKFQMKRERKAAKGLETLRASLDLLLPEFEKLGVKLCLENLPTGDAIPNEPEMFALLRDYEGAPLAYWHDWGHGQIRHELGFVHQGMLLKRLAGKVGGMHLHDVFPPLRDHGMPPGGLVDFKPLEPFLATDIPLVFEPRRDTPAADIARALDHFRTLFPGQPTA